MIDSVIGSINGSFNILTLPIMVFTQVNDCKETQSGLPPVTMRVCWQPASLTALKQASPSETTSLFGLRWRLAQRAIYLERNPSTTFMFIEIGCPLSLTDTAATKGVLMGEPRPRLPP